MVWFPCALRNQLSSSAVFTSRNNNILLPAFTNLLSMLSHELNLSQGRDMIRGREPAGEPTARQPCLLCGGTNAEIFLPDPNGPELVRCLRDGFVFRAYQPPDTQQLESFKNYIPNVRMYVEGRRPALAVYARVINKMIPGGKIVDVGCSVGTLFEFFPPGNWQRFGIDLSEFNAEEARSRHDVQTFCGTLRDAGFPDGSFDLITMLDTFPMVPDPRSELRESSRILKHGGIIGIEIEGWFYWKVTSHGPVCKMLSGISLKLHPKQLHYFSRKNLVALLQSEGFRIVNCIPGFSSASGFSLQERISGIHYKISSIIHKLSAGHLSIAARELILARKTI
jgi:SAM-dependent methyltransferase